MQKKGDTEKAKCRPERGVKEDDPVSPKLFTRVPEHKFRNLNWSSKHGLSINGRKLSNLRLGDGIVLFANSNGERQEMVKELTELSTDA
jgi:hypothetical protein